MTRSSFTARELELIAAGASVEADSAIDRLDSLSGPDQYDGGNQG